LNLIASCHVLLLPVLLPFRTLIKMMSNFMATEAFILRFITRASSLLF
jgi:hypothetical protein